MFEVVDRMARLENDVLSKGYGSKIDPVAKLDSKLMHDELVRVKEDIKRQSTNLSSVKGDLQRNFQKLTMAIQQSFQNYSRN